MPQKRKYAPVPAIFFFYLFNLDYSRVELGPITRRRQVKLWLSPANPPHHSKWDEIGPPLGKKGRYQMNIVKHNPKKKVFSGKYSNFLIINCFLAISAFFMNSSGLIKGIIINTKKHDLLCNFGMNLAIFKLYSKSLSIKNKL